MKILQISTGFDITYSGGGIPNYVRNVSTALTNAGHDVYVLYSQDNGKDKKHLTYKTINFNTSMKPFHLDSVLVNEDIYRLESIIKDIKPDIIHVHMMIDLPIFVLDMFRQYAKLVISLHDYSHLCNRIILIDSNGKLCENSFNNLRCNNCISKEDTISNRYIRRAIKEAKNLIGIKNLLDSNGHNERFMSGRELFSNADALIAVSNRVKEIYQFNGYTNDNFYVEHIGNYTAEDNFRKLFANRKYKEDLDLISLGFIGNLTYHKGGDILLNIANNITHKIHIYGGIDKGLYKKIKNIDNIVYHGKYSHDDLKSILESIDVGLVLPIWEDNAPQVVFEFLNSGIPVIATRMGGIPDFINDSNGMLFDIENDIHLNIAHFINNNIYNFYNSRINKFEGTKTPDEHVLNLLAIYNKL